VTESSQNTPLVSVIMITYKHEAFIAEAIEGVLMQECDFEVELIIADDSSPDKTSLIVSKYIETHPKGHWIKYTRHKHNKGMMPNFIWALEQAKGKYIALCEGDDYWVDRCKLQKQINLLEVNSKSSICVHDAWSLDDKGALINFVYQVCKTNYTFREVINQWFPTGSIVFKKELLNLNSKLWKGAICGDLPILALMAGKGEFLCIPQKMNVYRLHQGGISNTIHQEENFNLFLNRMRMYALINVELKNRFDNDIKDLQFEFYKRIKRSAEYNCLNGFRRTIILLLFKPYNSRFFKIFRAELKHSLKFYGVRKDLISKSS
jgi:glycosyltransferase involved in cell wall biosynthesis